MVDEEQEFFDVYIHLDDEGYVRSRWFSPTDSEDELKFTYHKDDPFMKDNIQVYQYQDGELVPDEEKRKKLKQEEERKETSLSKEDLNENAIAELAQQVADLSLTLMKGGG